MSGPSRSRTRIVLFLAFYALVILLAPALHHDFACHLKSPAHCTACVADAAASRTDSLSRLGIPVLTDLDPVPAVVRPVREDPRPLRASGRAPPLA